MPKCKSVVASVMAETWQPDCSNLIHVMYGAASGQAFLPFQFYNSDLRPHANTSFEAEKTKAAIDIQKSSFLLIEARPLFVYIFDGTPLESEKLETELHPMRMSGKGQVNMLMMLQGYALPVGRVMGH